MIENLSTNEEKVTLFLGLAKNIDGRTKFHKQVFLGKEEHSLDLDLKFIKYNYGPFSFDLNNLLVELEKKDIIKVEKITYMLIDEVQVLYVNKSNTDEYIDFG